ncbi:MAG: sugar transporter substrate-binding protein [Rhodoglobus sp.]|nr:sugar transporter substrate-binding protein [Rhodoglobus sp.]
MSIRRHGRKALGVIAVSAVIALTACSGGGQAAPTAQPTLSSDPVTISFAWWGNDARAEATLKIIDAFEAKYPNITVEPQGTDFASYFDKLATQTAGGSTPDAMQMQDVYLRTYANNGTLLDLDSVNSILDESGYSDSALSTGKIDDTLYALPVSLSAQAMFVNERILKASGVKLPDDDTWTWDDFADFAKKISDAGNGAYYGADITRAFGPAQLEDWARQSGDQTFDADGDLVIKKETLSSYFQFYLDLQNSGAGQPAAQTVENWNGGQTSYPSMTGNAATVSLAFNWIAQLTTATGDPFLILKTPTKDGEPPATFNRANFYWSISSKSKHPAEAALFLNFFVNDPAAIELTGTERGLPVNTTALDLLQPNLSDNDKAQLEYADRIKDFVGAPYIVPPASSTTVDAMLQTYVEAVLFEQQTPDEAADGFIKDMQAAIDDAK